MLLRAAAPGPDASTRGRWPKTVAAEVMSTGRSRVRAASRTAASTRKPAGLKLIGELDDQDAVLGDQSDERDQSHLRVDIDGRQVRES